MWCVDMNVLILLILAICMLLSCVSYPLARYVQKMEEDMECQGCQESKRCLAKRKLFKGSTYLDEFMLVSFVGVASYCRKNERIKYRTYIFIVLVATMLVGFLFWSKGVNLLGVVFGVSALMLLSLSIVDWNTEYIPVEYTMIVFICGLIHLFADFSNWYEYVIGLVAVSGFLLLVDKIATPLIARRHEGDEAITTVIGDGDIKLMAATGLLLGWKLNFLALGIGCISGSVIHLIRMKIKGSGAQLALGPYLSLGVYITMICGEQLISWYLNMLGF